jgi:hypothetical protein
VTAILVGAYKTFQSAGGAMAKRMALKVLALSLFTMDWTLFMAALVVIILASWAVANTNSPVENLTNNFGEDGEKEVDVVGAAPITNDSKDRG